MSRARFVLAGWLTGLRPALLADLAAMPDAWPLLKDTAPWLALSLDLCTDGSVSWRLHGAGGELTAPTLAGLLGAAAEAARARRAR